MEKQKRALVVGMAKSGVASARLLYQMGYEVTVNDMKNEIAGLEAALKGIEYINALGSAPDALIDGKDLVVLSPVIPIFSDFAKKARKNGAEVIGEIELGYRYCNRGSKLMHPLPYNMLLRKVKTGLWIRELHWKYQSQQPKPITHLMSKISHWTINPGQLQKHRYGKGFQLHEMKACLLWS